MPVIFLAMRTTNASSSNGTTFASILWACTAFAFDVVEESRLRKIFTFLAATVDGYYEGPNQEFDWPTDDEEFDEFSLAQLDEVDALLFGRVTNELMASSWRPAPLRAARSPRVTAESEGREVAAAAMTAGWP
jgi:hypothetical protein